MLSLRAGIVLLGFHLLTDGDYHVVFMEKRTEAVNKPLVYEKLPLDISS